MAKVIDYKKVAEKLQKEVDKLKEKLEVTYQKGFEAAHAAVDKIESAYEKHIQKAKAAFYKEQYKASAVFSERSPSVALSIACSFSFTGDISIFFFSTIIIIFPFLDYNYQCSRIVG